MISTYTKCTLVQHTGHVLTDGGEDEEEVHVAVVEARLVVVVVVAAAAALAVLAVLAPVAPLAALAPLGALGALARALLLRRVLVVGRRGRVVPRRLVVVVVGGCCGCCGCCLLLLPACGRARAAAAGLREPGQDRGGLVSWGSRGSRRRGRGRAGQGTSASRAAPTESRRPRGRSFGRGCPRGPLPLSLRSPSRLPPLQRSGRAKNGGAWLACGGGGLLFGCISIDIERFWWLLVCMYCYLDDFGRNSN